MSISIRIEILGFDFKAFTDTFYIRYLNSQITWKDLLLQNFLTGCHLGKGEESVCKGLPVI